MQTEMHWNTQIHKQGETLNIQYNIRNLTKIEQQGNRYQISLLCQESPKTQTHQSNHNQNTQEKQMKYKNISVNPYKNAKYWGGGEIKLYKKETHRLHNQTNAMWKCNIINYTTQTQCGGIFHTHGNMLEHMSKVHHGQHIHIVWKMTLSAM